MLLLGAGVGEAVHGSCELPVAVDLDVSATFQFLAQLVVLPIQLLLLHD